MTDDDKPVFVRLLARLSVALREPEPDVITLQTYYAALQDVEVEFLVAAADRLLRGASWFPKPAEWRTMVSTIAAERLEAQRAFLRKLPAPLCPRCDDT